MPKKNLPYNISLDTSFVEGQNFLAGSKMKELGDLCQKGMVKLFLTDITYREILARFRKNMETTVEKIKKPKELLSTNAKLLRNFPELKPFFDFPTVDIDSLCTRFQADFDEWLKNNGAEIIPTGHITIKEVFQDYFDNNPPFKEGEKKYEFPDAFTLKALVEYFSKTKSKSHLLSSDTDFLSFENGTIIPTNDPSILFDMIIRTTSEKLAESAIKLIESEFKVSKIKLERDIKEMIVRAIEDEMDSTYQIDDLEVDSVENIDVSDIEIETFSIVSLDTDNHSAKLVCEISLSFDVSFTADDYSEAWYDKEDDKWHFVESQTFNISDTYDIEVNITAHFDLDEDFAELEIEDINNGKSLDVVDSFRPWRHR